MLHRWYLRKNSKNSYYSKHGLSITVLPGVFHPGLFLSTNIFIEFIKTLELSQKKVLELGAGSGMISLFCAKQGAIVTASDINRNAFEGIQQNAKKNKLNVSVILSDLFEKLDPSQFDVIIINPPYYPKNPRSEMEQAFYCGEDFDYFKRLFKGLKIANNECDIYMILSEDCDCYRISKLAQHNGLILKEVMRTKKWLEWNYIFKLIENE